MSLRTLFFFKFNYLKLLVSDIKKIKLKRYAIDKFIFYE